MEIFKEIFTIGPIYNFLSLYLHLDPLRVLNLALHINTKSGLLNCYIVGFDIKDFITLQKIESHKPKRWRHCNPFMAMIALFL